MNMTRRDEYEDDFYTDEEELEVNMDEEIELLLEDDEISPEEAGFWHGEERFWNPEEEG